MLVYILATVYYINNHLYLLSVSLHHGVHESIHYVKKFQNPFRKQN